MFINKHINIFESSLLIEFIRLALKENFKNNITISESINNLSDTDVLSYAIIGKKSPKNVNIELYENILLNKLKNHIIDYSYNLTEIIDNDVIYNFIHEIGSLKSITSKNILNEDIATDITNMIKSDLKKPSNQRMFKKIKNLNLVNKDLKNPSNKKMVDNFKKAFNIGQGPEKVGFKPKESSSMEQSVKASDESRKTFLKNLHKLATGSNNDTSKEKPSEPKKIKNTPKIIETKPSPHVLEPKETDGFFTNLAHKLQDNFPKVYQFVQNHGTTIGVAALVGVAGYLSYKAYQRYFSKAGQACSNKSGAEKNDCIIQFKRKAINERIKVLQKSIGMCKKSSNPIKCRHEIQQKIIKLRNRI